MISHCEYYVSIILPIYNRKSTIKRTLKSIFNQSYTNWELIIIDDQSNDGTWEYLKELEATKNIKLIRTPINSGGPAVPRNLGIKYSNGDFIAFIDSDDEWKKDKLKIQLDYIKKYNVQFICSKAEINRHSKINKKNDDKPIDYLKFDTLIKRNIIVTSSVVICKKILHNKMFPEDNVLISIEDYYLWLNVHKENIRSIKLNDSLVVYYITNDSITGNYLNKIRRLISLYILFGIRNNILGCCILNLIINILSRIIRK